MTEEDLDRIARGYREFAGEARPTSPLYARLAEHVAGSRPVLRFLAGLPTGKRQPNLLLAALQLLDGAPADGVELERRITEDGDRVRETVLARATQTNEPARCGALLPVLAQLDGPLTLVEVGTSAGLCLYPDRYGYDYDGVQVGPPGALRIRVETSGPVPVPDAVPEVAARIGIDLNPLDPTDPGDRAWLRALVWPGPVADERLRRLDAAAEVAAREPATLLRGDLVERLPDALDLAAPGSTVVVMHTALLPYVPGDVRARFVETVTGLPVRWLAQEPPGAVPGTGERPLDGWGEEFVVSLDGRPLARSAPHGGRLDWLDGGLGASRG
ncbi:DUF2332 domain-containing protein [Blastococcus sp. TF02A-35]|uniref:DUF2332 domain-containing protein n=1 Tax=Blastococcus sp. TF02A-35 TaxID=2559612 RepID=UPI001073F261|nr:DUF2332 domain-containing protein [Blastococcus sp. TF02A_35]TFV47171.1 DUF2332 domain-containing protein [Blastococcus sp. TF02A_35]